jgi:uncharacterized membrane protein
VNRLTNLAPRLLAGALIFGGFGLRLPNATSQLEYDEVIAMLFGRHSFGEIVAATAADTMPPLYYWLLHLWTPAGELFSARFLSTLLGTATLPVFYALARRLAGPAEALAAMGLLAVSPIAVFYGHYARMYALLTLCGALASYCFVRWLQGGQRRWLVGFTVAAGLSLWVHNLAGLTVLSLDLAFLLGWRFWPGGFRRRVADLAASHLALLLIYTPWLLYLPGQLEKVNRAFWIPTPGLGELARTLLMWAFHLPLPPLLVAPLAFVALTLAALTGVETVRRWRSASPLVRPRLLIAVTLTLAPVGIMFLVSLVRPVYVERAVLLSAGMYYLLLVGALARIPLRPLAWALALGLWAGLGIGLIYQAGYTEFPRSPFREAAQALRAELRPGDLVLHDNKLSFFPMHYFAPDLPQAYLPDLPGTANDTLAPGSMDVLGLHPTSLEDATAAHGNVWYVVFDRALAQAAAEGTPHQYHAWLDEHLRRAGELRAADLHLFRYQPRSARP